MISQLRAFVLRRAANLLIRSGAFRRNLGRLDSNYDPQFLRAASLLRGASDEEAIFVRDLVERKIPDTHLWVLLETHRKTSGYFVEFGAADGIELSNTFLLEKDFGWRGVVAEPNPLWHEALTKNRKADIDFRCVFERTGDRIKFAATRHALLSTIADFADRDGHAKSRQEHNLVEVETVSLNDLLEAHRAPRDIDFISIDTEGSELDILRRFDFKKWNVSLFSIEHNHANETKIDALMHANGYERRYRDYTIIDGWYRRIRSGHHSDAK